jgi:hypothetical protein
MGDLVILEFELDPSRPQFRLRSLEVPAIHAEGDVPNTDRLASGRSIGAIARHGE